MLIPDFSRFSLILLKNGEAVFTSEKGGLRPLVECIRTCKAHYSGCVLCDRVIGLAAAKLVVSSGLIEKVVTRTASRGGVEFLKACAIPIETGEVVDRIMNLDRSAPCPMEVRAQATDDASAFYTDLCNLFGMGELGPRS